MAFKFIAAVSNNNVIGVDGKIPWTLKKDLARFKEITQGQICLMGRKTYDSLKNYFKGEILPGRIKYVLTRDTNATFEYAIPISYDVAINLAKNSTVFVIGGSDIYTLFFEWANEIYLTRVNLDIDENQDNVVFFPKLIDIKDSFDLIETEHVAELEISFNYELWEKSKEK